MRINSAGNIGIHTTAPNYTLDVIGTLGVSVGVTTGSLNVTGASIMEDNLTVTTGSVIISTNDYTPIINATSATGGSIIFNRCKSRVSISFRLEGVKPDFIIRTPLPTHHPYVTTAKAP